MGVTGRGMRCRILNGLQEDVNLAMDEPAPKDCCVGPSKLRPCRLYKIDVGPQ